MYDDVLPAPKIAGLGLFKLAELKIHLMIGVPSCPTSPTIPKAPPSKKVKIIIRLIDHQKKCSINLSHCHLQHVP